MAHLSDTASGQSRECHSVPLPRSEGQWEGSINHLALHDFGIFKELYDFDLAVFDSAFGTDCADFLCNYVNTGCNSKVYNQRICDRICDMSKTLAEASTVEEFMADMVPVLQRFRRR